MVCKLQIKNNPTLSDRLKTIWPNLEAGRKDDWLWKHEWKSHGCCIQQIQNPTQYFQLVEKVDELFQAKGKKENLITYMMTKAPPKNDLPYTESILRSAIANMTWPYAVYLSCHANGTKHILLKEVYICLDTGITNFKSCPKPKNKHCGNKDIFLPHFQCWSPFYFSNKISSCDPIYVCIF